MRVNVREWGEGSISIACNSRVMKFLEESDDAGAPIGLRVIVELSGQAKRAALYNVYLLSLRILRL